MKKQITCWVAAAMIGITGAVHGAPQTGTWFLALPDQYPGSWAELFWGGGEGMPGNEFIAADDCYALDGALLDQTTVLETTPFSVRTRAEFSGGVLTLSHDSTSPWFNPDDPTATFTVPLESMTLTKQTLLDFFGNSSGQIDFLLEAEGHLDDLPGYAVMIRAFYIGLPTLSSSADSTVQYADLTWFEITITEVEPAIYLVVDIKPGSVSNPVNLSARGVLPVAILGTALFDVQNIDPETIRLAGLAPLRWAYEDVVVADPDDEGESAGLPDEFGDLALKFSIRELSALLSDCERNERVELTLTAQLRDGTTVEGTDTIRVLRRMRKAPARKAVGRNRNR